MDGLQSKEARTLIRWLKEGPSGTIPIAHDNQTLGSLHAVTWEDAGDRAAIARLGQWQQSTFALFAVPVPVTPPGARQWLIEQVLEAPERLLFWIRDVHGNAVGHVGLSRFDFTVRTVAVRDVVCGQPGAEPLVAEAVDALRGWVRETFRMWTVDAGPLLAAA